jgi:hypothetical protein
MKDSSVIIVICVVLVAVVAIVAIAYNRPFVGDLKKDEFRMEVKANDLGNTNSINNTNR